MYIRPSQLTSSAVSELLSTSHLPPDVEIRPYDSIFEDLTKLSAELKPQGKKVLISNKASLAVEDALLSGAGAGKEGEKEGGVVQVVRSPVTDAKAIKNAVEVNGFRQCHLRDGAALVSPLPPVNRGAKVDVSSLFLGSIFCLARGTIRKRSRVDRELRR